MTDPELEPALDIVALLDEARAELRARGMLDLESWRQRYPDLAEQLLPLLETLRSLDTAAEDWKETPEAVTRSGEAGQAEPAGPEEVLPDQVGRYRILGRVAAGGMGTVYRAHDPQLDRVVALKVPLFRSPASGRSLALQRFLREARAAAAVRHAHVCPLYDVGEQDGIPYVVMAFVEGESLAQRLRRGRFDDPREAVVLVRQVAEALNAVHAHGIVHRDLKPGNILLEALANEPGGLSPRSKALLTDFGLARPEDDTERLTAEGVVVGTPAYMALEQVSREAGPLGPWTDLCSLGVVLYQMLTGRLPFEETDPLALLYQIGQEPPPPSRFRPDLDPALETIVQKAMARRPEERYRSARELIAALDGWLLSPLSPLGSFEVALDACSTATQAYVA